MIRRPGIRAVLALSIGAIAVATTSHAYDPITWYSIDGGGAAFATGGGYRLGATIGQADAGLLAAGSHTLRGGFWFGGPPQQVGVGDAPPPAARFRFYPISPNPVRARFRLAFDLPRAAPVSLSVFDVSGRVMHRWKLGLLPAGHQERAWSAVDAGGRPLSSGVYYLRLETDREQGVHRIAVVR